MSLQQCGNNYCPDNKAMIDGDCHDLDYQAGNKIVLIPPGTTRQCWCTCSCLAVDTPISTPTGTVKVQDIQQGTTTVLAAGLDLTWTEQLVNQASYATPGVTEHTIYIRYQLQGEPGPRELVVTRDHPLVLYPGRTLIVADALQISDRLVDRDGQAVQVVDVRWGSYSGSFYEFATTLTPPDAKYTNHLVLTNGVVSGDFAVQVYTDIPAGHPSDTTAAPASALAPSSGARHEVGSDEWVASNPSATTTDGIVVVNTYMFSPATIITAPEHASDFLPAWQAAELQKVAPKRSIGDVFYHQLGAYVLSQFKCLYRDVNFQISWYNPAVNSHSYVSHGKKHVLLSGGLLRIVGMEYAGIALAIAHEIGHLYGTPDGSPLCVTCEGEADYYGAKITLRKLWFGELYGNFMFEAIDQLKLLYSYIGEDTAAHTDRAGRRYPSNQCRLDTINAAMAGQPIPPCAACGTVDWATLTPAKTTDSVAV